MRAATPQRTSLLPPFISRHLVHDARPEGRAFWLQSRKGDVSAIRGQVHLSGVSSGLHLSVSFESVSFEGSPAPSPGCTPLRAPFGPRGSGPSCPCSLALWARCARARVPARLCAPRHHHQAQMHETAAPFLGSDGFVVGQSPMTQKVCSNPSRFERAFSAGVVHLVLNGGHGLLGLPLAFTRVHSVPCSRWSARNGSL